MVNINHLGAFAEITDFVVFVGSIVLSICLILIHKTTGMSIKPIYLLREWCSQLQQGSRDLGEAKEHRSCFGGLWWPNTLLHLCWFSLYIPFALLTSFWASVFLSVFILLCLFLSHINTHTSIHISTRRTIMVHIVGRMLAVNQTLTLAENFTVILALCRSNDIGLGVWLGEIKGLL